MARHSDALLEHELLPQRPPLLDSGHVFERARDYRWAMRAAVLAALEDVDCVGHAIRHRHEPLVAQTLVLDETTHDGSLGKILPRFGARLGALEAGLRHELVELPVHRIREDILHGLVKGAWIRDETLNILH